MVIYIFVPQIWKKKLWNQPKLNKNQNPWGPQTQPGALLVMMTTVPILGIQFDHQTPRWRKKKNVAMSTIHERKPAHQLGI